MIVKDDYRCSSCNTSRSCFVFNEFVLPFALCMECYVRIKAQLDGLEPEEHTCMLCDASKDIVYPIKTQNNLLLSGILFMCKDCFENLTKLMQEQRYL